jgi:hypothetical protein
MFDAERAVRAIAGLSAWMNTCFTAHSLALISLETRDSVRLKLMLLFQSDVLIISRVASRIPPARAREGVHGSPWTLDCCLRTASGCFKTRSLIKRLLKSPQFGLLWLNVYWSY